MASDSRPAEQVMASLFENKSVAQMKRLLARLEFGGASIYRGWAAAENNEKARTALLAAAVREDDNAKLLQLMTTAKPKCEKCGAPLALDAAAFACAFQCTFCPSCSDAMNSVCPNCGGELKARDARDFADAGW
ncbi:MAG: DUF1272 domain-containing protein [Candidatus Binataceae bacterium]